jgi:hypothetical protein
MIHDENDEMNVREDQRAYNFSIPHQERIKILEAKYLKEVQDYFK